MDDKALAVGTPIRVEGLSPGSYKDSLLEAVEHVRTLTHIIGPHFDGSDDLRSKYKEMNNWLSEIAVTHLELGIVGGWKEASRKCTCSREVPNEY